jgi:hypothetical protein
MLGSGTSLLRRRFSCTGRAGGWLHEEMVLGTKVSYSYCDFCDVPGNSTGREIHNLNNCSVL